MPMIRHRCSLRRDSAFGRNEQQNKRSSLVGLSGVPTGLIFQERGSTFRIAKQALHIVIVIVSHVGPGTILVGHLGFHPVKGFNFESTFSTGRLLPFQTIVSRIAVGDIGRLVCRRPCASRLAGDLFRMMARASVTVSSTLLVRRGTKYASRVDS